MKRILTALVLIPIVVWAVVQGPQWALMAVMAAVGLLGFHEFDAIVAGHRIAPSGYAGLAGGLALLLTPEPVATGSAPGPAGSPGARDSGLW